MRLALQGTLVPYGPYNSTAHFTGDVWRFAIISAIFLFVVLGFGVFISSISQNAGQAIQLSILIILPQVLMSGLIFPLDSMAALVRPIGYCLPLTWFNIMAKGVMLRDATFAELSQPLAILIVMAML